MNPDEKYVHYKWEWKREVAEDIPKMRKRSLLK